METKLNKVTPKDFFLWFGAMVALYVSVFSLLELFFDYINHAFPDALSGYVDPYSSAIRFAIASLVVLFPVFLLLMRLIRKDILAMPEKGDLWVRRWALYLTLFIAGITVVVDLVTLINTFLGGDITTRFTLKVVVVFLVVGAGFLHFLADLRGYWDENPRYSRMVQSGAAAVVAATIVAGFFIIGTPGQVRLYRFDDQKISDLQNIQWQVVNYWQTKGKLPMALADLNDPISGFTPPVDSQTGTPYEYAVLTSISFKLCAVFNADMQPDSQYYNTNGVTVAKTPPSVPFVNTQFPADLSADTWQHGKGEICFTRTIDPERYPPFKK